MDELIDVMKEILLELQEINSKIDDIKGYGICSSLSDLGDKIDEITGMGVYTISDICDKIDAVDTTIMMK